MSKIIVMKELETKEEIEKQIYGKIIKEVKYEGVSNIDIYFTDGTYISISADDCFDFFVEMQEDQIKCIVN
jgi:hypothetical protein